MLAEELRQIIKGEILTDKKTLDKASRDASILEIKPQVVVAPRGAEDIKSLVKFAAKAKRDALLLGTNGDIYLTARAGGTDMGGGPLSQSIIVDFVAHLNKFKEMNRAKSQTPRGIRTEGMARVEPGMFYRDFEKETLKKNLLLPPYPASREICTVGGMVANNAGGEKTLAYGKIEDYIEELKVVLADGEEHSFRALPRAELAQKLKENGFEGDIYRGIYKLIDKNYNAIMAGKPDVSKNSAGYYLWNVWDKEKDTFDLSRLLVGSQGTLGLITEITFKLVRPNPHSLMAVIFLNDIAPVADITNELLKFQPESLECYDDKTMKLAIRFFPSILARVKQNPITFTLSFLPDLWMLIKNKGLPKLVILAEFTGQSEEEIRERLQSVKKALRRFNVPEHFTRHEREEGKYWTIRRESFNLLRQHVKGKHTAPVIDDVVVKPEYLSKFLPELRAIVDSYGDKLISTIQGHNGNGNFHIIPLMDFKDPAARAIIPKLMDEVYALVLKYNGSITAEHNDGLIRTSYLEKMYGPKITELFKEVKNIFDPLGIFNPGKKVPVAGLGLAKVLEYMQKS